ncbi:hypothetical protein D3C76_1643710 [compost metagenome]
MNAGSRTLLGGDFSKPFTGFKVKAAAHGQRNREDGPVAVNDIRHEEQRNLLSADLQMSGLLLDYIPGSNTVQNTSDALHYLRLNVQFLKWSG